MKKQILPTSEVQYQEPVLREIDNDNTVKLDEEQYNSILREIKKAHSDLKNMVTPKEVQQKVEEIKPIQPIQQVQPIQQIPAPTPMFPMEKPTIKQPKRKLKLIIGWTIGTIIAIMFFLALVYGAKLSMLLSGIITVLVLLAYFGLYTWLIFIITKPKQNADYDGNVVSDICPSCKNKLVKDRIIQEGNRLVQNIRCSNNLCMYKTELVYNI